MAKKYEIIVERDASRVTLDLQQIVPALPLIADAPEAANRAEMAAEDASLSVARAIAWAEGDVPPDPEDLTRKSAKSWADDARATAERIDLGALDAAVTQTGDDALAAAAQVGLASAQVALAAAEKLAAQFAKAQAEAARDEAEGYATGAAFAGNWFDSIALGRAAVADGQTFGVKAGLVDNLLRPTVYQRTSASTQEIIVGAVRGTEVDALTAGLSAIEDGASHVKMGQAVDYAVRAVSSDYRALGGFLPDGRVRGEAGIDWSTVSEVRFGDSIASGYWVRWLTNDGRVIGGITLDNRLVIGDRQMSTLQIADLSAVVQSDGLPSAPLIYPENLRETRRKISTLAVGANPETLVICAGPGDSWTDGRGVWVGALATRLKALYGDGGPGYVGALTGSSDASAFWTGFDDWTARRCNGSSPSTQVPSMSLSACRTDSLTTPVTLQCGADFATAALHYIGQGAGAIRYRYGTGAGVYGDWASLTLSTSGLRIATLAAPPAGTRRLQIERVSGTVEIAGADIRSGATGVVVHKCGMGGSRALDWLYQDAASMARGWQALGPDLHIAMTAVNDRNARTAAQYAVDLAALYDSLRAAHPLVDLLSVSQPEVLGAATLTNPLSGYNAHARRIAVERGGASLFLQSHFGKADTSDYGDDGSEYFTSADALHPSVKGRAVVSAAIIAALNL